MVDVCCDSDGWASVSLPGGNGALVLIAGKLKFRLDRGLEQEQPGLVEGGGREGGCNPPRYDPSSKFHPTSIS